MIFYRISHPTIGSGLVVRYREFNAFTRGERGLEISASRDGVSIQGYSETVEDVEGIKQVLDRVHQWHLRIKEAGRSLKCADVDNTPLSQEPECVIEARESRFAGDDIVLEARQFEGDES
jgi:hypothetical protein